MNESYTFDLRDFEGPLDYLVYLIQKNEIDIYGVQLKEIVDQFQTLWKASDVNGGAEFIGSIASLVYLKSRMLLPKQEQALQQEAEEGDPKFEIIHQLIEYCTFKKAAKTLCEQEISQAAFFLRGVETEEPKKRLGIEHLQLEDLAALFKDLMAKQSFQTGQIHEEEWRVSDKIAFLRSLKSSESVNLASLFLQSHIREEWIVLFLAILELMKTGEIAVVKSQENSICLLFKG